MAAVVADIDREIVEGCRKGQPDAFRILFETFKDRVYSIALRYAGDRATAMDITQDTFVKLYSRIGDFRGESGFQTWLYRLVANSCLDHHRRRRRLVPLLDEIKQALTAPGNRIIDELVRSQMRVEVQAAISRLPAEQRIVIVLRYTEGLSYEEIAEALGCSAGTVASRLNRAHKVLERRLARFARESGGSYV